MTQDRSHAVWLDEVMQSSYSLDNLPYGVLHAEDGGRVCTRVMDSVVDLVALAALTRPEWVGLFAAPSLNRFIEQGPGVWSDVREWLIGLLGAAEHWESVQRASSHAATAEMCMPVEVGDFVDFYASIDHATNVGKIFRPDDASLPTSWRHIPIGYHGRAGSIDVSGRDVARPRGQFRDEAGGLVFAPSRQLDFEAEVGFVVGKGTRGGATVAPEQFHDYVFGVVGLNDWSARDIQSFEYRPLGPFLGKSFATSVSAWVTPLAALEHAQVPGVHQDPSPLPHLLGRGLYGYDIQIEVFLNGVCISRPELRTMYWTPSQMLAHMTSNGARLRVGDLFGSGTISGSEPQTRGSLLELSWGGARPILVGTESRRFLADGDEVQLRYSAPGHTGRIALGEVGARIAPSE